MIIVTLMGGMGNQMFQYAFGKSLSLRYNVPLKIDLSFLQRRDLAIGFVYRDYDLDLFNIEEDFTLNSKGKTVKINEFNFSYSVEYIDKIGQLLKKNTTVIIEGYWQSPKYFKDFEIQIRKDFEFKENIKNSKNLSLIDVLDKIHSTNSVMINIRRTDYLNTSFHGVLGSDYINKSVAQIESKINEAHYFVFSDDIEWCRAHIELKNMLIIDHSYKGDRFGDYLQLMKSCKNFIIPNSTFAWWAAWLNNNPQKIVIAPENWFTNSQIDTTDLIPSEWIRL